jgi:hypothetical protein
MKMLRKKRTDGNSGSAVAVNVNRVLEAVALARHKFDHDIYVDRQADVAGAR